MRAVGKHTDCRWLLLYIERWLKAPAQLEDGSLTSRDKGTPQGGVMTPRMQKVTLSLLGLLVTSGVGIILDFVSHKVVLI